MGPTCAQNRLSIFTLVILNVFHSIIEFLRTFVDVFLDLVAIDIELNAGLAVGVLNPGDVVPVEKPASYEKDGGTEEEQEDEVPHQTLRYAA